MGFGVGFICVQGMGRGLWRVVPVVDCEVLSAAALTFAWRGPAIDIPPRVELGFIAIWEDLRSTQR